MEKITPPKRSQRRSHMENVRKKAHKKAAERMAEQSRRDTFIYSRSYEDYYRGAMKNDGHWIDGGCSRVNCGLCQPRGLTCRDKKLQDRFDEEYAEWMWGNE